MNKPNQTFYSVSIQNQLDRAGAVIDHWEYRTLPVVRFIGQEISYAGFGGYNGGHWAKVREQTAAALDAMPEWASGFDYDLTLSHHFGKSVETERCHDFIGRFMKTGAPVPEGFVSWEFCPQFAFAVFSGGHDELHEGAGFDVNALYDVTRNIICEQKVTIPYPEMYWTAEVQFDRAEGTIYNPERLYSEDRTGADHCGLLFSVSLKIESARRKCHTAAGFYSLVRQRERKQGCGEICLFCV